MKLATLKDGSRDGMLAVVSRDLKLAHLADGIAPTLQRALDDWPFIAPQLEDLSLQLNAGRARRPFEFVAANCMAPLPRAFQWVDGSSYQQHAETLVRAATGKVPDNLWRDPRIYQGGSDDFLGPCDDVVFAEEDWGIDFEAELGVILGDTTMQVRKDEALQNVRLLVLINDWSLRSLSARELDKGFGFFQSKPASAFAPLAVTPDEIGDAWRDGLARVKVSVAWNGTAFMSADAGEGTRFNFAELIAHAAKTRNLRAGCIVGAGTVSSGGAPGCIAELRAREALEPAAGEDNPGKPGKPRTGYMKFGDRVVIDALDAHGQSVFGRIDQQVTSLRRRRASMQGAAALDAQIAPADSAQPDTGDSHAGPIESAPLAGGEAGQSSLAAAPFINAPAEPAGSAPAAAANGAGARDATHAPPPVDET